mmetsp:Transcript_39290/g.29012  ORF Transcript_39290/g.29012 Transcript_39290/m.29012 type:complete len:116 (+) Transcript_39290:613-960(+)
MAISPNNGAFLLNLTFPFVNFYVIMVVHQAGVPKLAIFNLTITCDDSMRITREIDSALNLSKLFINTPVRSLISQERLAKRLPYMYVQVLQRSTKHAASYLRSLYSHWLERFQSV